MVKTRRGLDYERETRHVLVVGTVENAGSLAGATTKVLVNVQDVNDIPPVFTLVPRPVWLDDNVPIGALVANLVATDSDGTAPGNTVRLRASNGTDELLLLVPKRLWDRIGLFASNVPARRCGLSAVRDFHFTPL